MPTGASSFERKRLKKGNRSRNEHRKPTTIRTVRRPSIFQEPSSKKKRGKGVGGTGAREEAVTALPASVGKATLIHSAEICKDPEEWSVLSRKAAIGTAARQKEEVPKTGRRRPAASIR